MCYNPITIKKDDGTYMKVPCGKCLECLRQYQNDWSNRMYEEIKAHDGKAVFFTLTYSDETVPKNYLHDGKIYRSYSDYNYDNTVIRLVGKRILKEKVCSIIPKERLKFGVPAWKVLTDNNISVADGIYDFNDPEYDNKVQNRLQNVSSVFKDYVDAVSSTLPPSYSRCDSDYNMDDVEKWFEDYEGDMFSFDDVDDTINDFQDVLNDDHNCPVFDDLHRNTSDEDIRKLEEGRPIMSFNSVRKEDVIKWLNRGLNKIKRNFGHGFKWFVTSEYGPRTLRPHYHGILFGVTRMEAQCMFSDWNRHFGFSKIDNVDLTKGGTSYCAKYCAKGLYEHPLCTRDFFYMKKVQDEAGNWIPKCTEYHSKHYERCLEYFGIDEPIVDKTFHLVSKGLGLEYVEKNKDYFLSDFTDLNFVNEGIPDIVVVRDTENNFIEYLETDPHYLALENDGKITDEIYNKAMENRREYIETYRIKSKNPDYYERQFADAMDTFVQKFKYIKVTLQGKTLSYAMPQYYRAKILSDGLRAALASYVREVNDNLYREKLRALCPDLATRENTEIISLLEKEAQLELETRMSNARRKMEKQLNKSKL